MAYAANEANNADFKLEQNSFFRRDHSWEIRTFSLKSILLVLLQTKVYTNMMSSLKTLNKSSGGKYF